MGICFKPLWKLLIDRDMSKSELRIAVGISSSTLAKMYKNEYVALDVLVKICNVLQCQLSDIATIEFDKEQSVTEPVAD